MTAVLAREPARPASPVASESTGTYRPHLDGLRAVAVYLVVLFHAGADRVSGGFIGVDVFFVLSGYLVTQMLLRDLARPHGLRYGRFYARRVRRLLPASVAMLLVTAVVYSAVAAPGEAAGARTAFQASFLYVANWFFVHRSTGYFGADMATNPVLHVWSLAVEEQFYLVWPLLLGGGFWLARRLRAARPVAWIRVAVAVGAVASFTWAFTVQTHDPERAYYGTDARAYQLLAGALLALTPGFIRRIRQRFPSAALPRIVTPVAMLALLALATSLVPLGPISRGACATLATVAILGALDWHPAGPVHRLLSSSPMVYLGQISYGTYLWHWPVIVVAGIIADPTPTSLAAITILVATGIAALSFQLLEMPIRRSPGLDARRLPVIAVGLAISLICASVVLPRLLTKQESAAVPVASSASFTPVPAGLDLDRVAQDRFGAPVDCRDKDPSACTIVRGSGKHLLLMGDSNATMFIPAFTSMAKANDLTLSVSNADGCVWQRGINHLATLSPHCLETQEDTYTRIVPALRPDIIVLVDAELPDRLTTSDRNRTAASSSLETLRAPGRTLVLVKPVVRGPADHAPVACLDQATFVEACRFVVENPVQGPTLDLYRELSSGKPDVTILDLDRLACPYLPICDPIVGGHVVRWNFEHLAVGYSRTLGEDLLAAFQGQGLLPG